MNDLSQPARLSPKASLTGKTVLVVDDDKPLLMALSKVLRSEGARVLSAGGVSDAVGFLSLNYGRIDLVLTDMQMPTVSGKCILSAMKGFDPGVPVIVMTAFATDELRGACAGQGAFAFLEKPVDTATLLGVMNRALGRDHP